MAYSICGICGSMYEKNGRDYCQACHEKHEEEYGLIMDYIANNPNNRVIDIITETKVSLKTINRLVKEGVVSYKE